MATNSPGLQVIPDLIFDVIPNAFHDCRLRLLRFSIWDSPRLSLLFK